MRLGQFEKDAALALRPGSSLVRCGPMWGVMWRYHTGPLRERWHGQLIKEVVEGKKIDPEHLRPELEVWWVGIEFVDKTRRAVLQAMHSEALR